MSSIVKEKDVLNWMNNTSPDREKEVSSEKIKELQVKSAEEILKTIKSRGWINGIFPQIQGMITRFRTGKVDGHTLDDIHYIADESRHKAEALEYLLRWIARQLNEAESTKKEWMKKDKGSQKKGPISGFRSSFEEV